MVLVAIVMFVVVVAVADDLVEDYQTLYWFHYFQHSKLAVVLAAIVIVAVVAAADLVEDYQTLCWFHCFQH